MTYLQNEAESIAAVNAKIRQDVFDQWSQTTNPLGLIRESKMIQAQLLASRDNLEANRHFFPHDDPDSFNEIIDQLTQTIAFIGDRIANARRKILRHKGK